MNLLTELLSITASIIVALGGGGAIVFGLSSWLGKIWADKLMQKEKDKHEKELLEFQSKLKSENETCITELKNNLDIYKEKHLKEHSDKIAIYRLITDIVAELLGDLDMNTYTSLSLPKPRFDNFNRNRLRAYGYLAMLAPQNVMDAFDALSDLLLDIATERKRYQWEQVRELTLNLLNEVRKDIGIDFTPIRYNGKL